MKTHIKAQIQTNTEAQIQIRDLKEAMEGRDPGTKTNTYKSTNIHTYKGTNTNT